MKIPMASRTTAWLCLGWCLLSSVATTVNGQSSQPANATAGAYLNATASDQGYPMADFIAHNASQTCSNNTSRRPFNTQIRGVNLGGWMELEPWLTPSLFYQFLGGNENNTAMDSWTFCEVLGPKEANKQLHRHWKTWVTQSHIKELAASGINSIRLPVGDFIYKPYGPYVGCIDGGAAYVDQLLNWANTSGIEVLIDIHCHIGSQNGFDNSGRSMLVQWTSNLTMYPAGLVTFEHWPTRTAHWLGPYDVYTNTYPSINWAHIMHSLDTIRIIAERYKNHPAVMGLEPVNEPWEMSPIPILKKYYWEGYLIVKSIAPTWKYVIHDSFRFFTNIWGGFMAGCPDRAIDTHIYQAWFNPASRAAFYSNACSMSGAVSAMERAFGPVIVGEWSLATDNCAMWLNGFNDNLNGYPKLPCKFIPCGQPYMGLGQPGTPVNPSMPLQGPYGTGVSGPIYGQCPVDRDWYKAGAGPITGKEWVLLPPKAPAALDDTLNVRRSLAEKKLEAFSFSHGTFFWNFRTEIYEPAWSYLDAVKAGYMPTGNLNTNTIRTACALENSGAFVCVCKSGQLDSAVQGGMAYALNFQNNTNQSWVYNLTGKALQTQASIIFNNFFHKYRLTGATCDFGGVATLQFANSTGNSSINYTDDQFYVKVSVPVYHGPPLWLIIVGAVAAAFIGSIVGFLVAMNFSPAFNRKVRESGFFEPLRNSNNVLARSSLSLLALGDEYEPISDVDGHKLT